jgi:SAM-dependent methyltransferase
MYAVTKFHHIDKGLYVYRVHGENTWLKHNQEIQENVFRIHDQYAESLAEAWSDRNGLLKVEVGGRMNAKAGYVTVDVTPPADHIADLNERWPFKDGTVGCLRSYDVFEHLNDTVHTMKELYRVLAPGGYAFIQVPSTDGRGAWQDPTHKSFFNENSFAYYTDRFFNKYIHCPVRFQAIRLYTTEKDARGVCWTVAHLTKLSDERVPGIVSI